MSMQVVDAEYVEARRALLDALDALGPHRDAVIVAGAQAIYLQSGPGSLSVSDFTIDGDLAIDPNRLGGSPPLESLMREAGFELAEHQGALEPGIWEISTTIDGSEVKIPVDLIVPEGAAVPQGRRGARLGPHGNRAARKIAGLEAALVDNERRRIDSLDPSDRRSITAMVAGAAAMLVAKVHKINDRVESGRAKRLRDKDAADVVRLMQANPAAAVARTLADLRDHPRAAAQTVFAVERFQVLFGVRAGVGIEMAARALRLAMPEDRVRTICLAYADELRSAL